MDDELRERIIAKMQSDISRLRQLAAVEYLEQFGEVLEPDWDIRTGRKRAQPG